MSVHEDVRWLPENDQENVAKERLVELMARYEDSLCRYLTVLVADREFALDCGQETFLRAYQNLRNGRPVNAAWLWTVGRNLVLGEFRRRRRIALDFDAWDDVMEPATGESDRSRATRRALEKLSREEREVLYLFTIDRFPTSEIAEMLGIRPTAVRMRLSRARERFRAAFGAQS